MSSSIRVVTFSRLDCDGVRANANLFKLRDEAISFAQVLLQDEYDQHPLEPKHFVRKSETHIQYVEEPSFEYAFEILVEQKQIK